MNVAIEFEVCPTPRDACLPTPADRACYAYHLRSAEPIGACSVEKPGPWARSISSVAKPVIQSGSCVAELAEQASGGENSDDITRRSSGLLDRAMLPERLAIRCTVVVVSGVCLGRCVSMEKGT